MTARWRHVACPTCGALIGNRCTLVGGLSTDYVTTPHRARLREAGLKVPMEHEGPKPQPKIERLKQGLLAAQKYFCDRGCDYDDDGHIMHGGDSCCYTLRKIDQSLDTLDGQT